MTPDLDPKRRCLLCGQPVALAEGHDQRAVIDPKGGVIVRPMHLACVRREAEEHRAAVETLIRLWHGGGPAGDGYP